MFFHNSNFDSKFTKKLVKQSGFDANSNKRKGVNLSLHHKNLNMNLAIWTMQIAYPNNTTAY
jgi:hypothetical protein